MIVITLIQVPKGISLHICIDVLSISVKLMNSEEIHTTFDNNLLQKNQTKAIY